MEIAVREEKLQVVLVIAQKSQFHENNSWSVIFFFFKYAYLKLKKQICKGK